ncbi:hypothetical protein CPB85DRAFT_1440935 [Mucidula mucida]|nr:hypothetical protein CPB85DRAFT_1440935 [Mucidula mucida]
MYSGDWLSLIKEVLNMRTTINIYRSLYKYITTVDGESPSGHDDTVDEHLRSGVYFGYGLSSLILSLLPSKVITIVEIFGYHGDRTEALDVLQRAGGWSKESEEPTVSAADEGIRRLLCDMMVLTFHTVLSSVTFDGIDITMADKIVGSSSFARSQGKLWFITRKPSLPNHNTNSLRHVVLGNGDSKLGVMGCARGMASWRDLERESSWSKAIIIRSVVRDVCFQGSGPTLTMRRTFWRDQLSGLLQKIAGKKRRLVLPALEIGYIFLAITHAPREVLAKKMLPEIKSCLEGMKGRETLGGYHDDLCLSKFLEGVCLRYLAYPDVEAVLPSDSPSVEELTGMSEAECAKQAEARSLPFSNMDQVLSSTIMLFIMLVHYEYGRFLSRHGQEDKARGQFELVLSGKHLEVGPSGKKGKYSLKAGF